MKPIYTLVGLMILLAPAQAGPAKNYIYNPKFTSGMSAWHGIGEVVYLKPDYTESVDPVKGVKPVLKIPLKRTDIRGVMQEFTTADEPDQLRLRFEYCVSKDFKRSTDPSDYTQATTPKGDVTEVTGGGLVPQCDFWVRIDPGTIFHTVEVEGKSKWETVDVTFSDVIPTRNRAITFCVPCGQGSVYVRNVQVSEN